MTNPFVEKVNIVFEATAKLTSLNSHLVET